MKISEIINELTELKEIIGDRDLTICSAIENEGVNVVYTSDDGSIVSTSLEGEKIKTKLKKSGMLEPKSSEYVVGWKH